jgi:hypothetical protein
MVACPVCLPVLDLQSVGVPDHHVCISAALPGGNKMASVLQGGCRRV